MNPILRTLSLAFLVACSGGKDGSSDENTPGETDTETTGLPSQPITIASYNAGLAVGFVPGAPTRVDDVADAVAAIEADVVCLQEVWLPEHVTKIGNSAGSTFGSQYFPAANQSSDAQCAPGELDAMLDCADLQCEDSCVDELPDCVLGSCGGQFFTTSNDCKRCIMAMVGNDSTVIEDTCTDAPIEYAYGGSYGTGILSKYPILGEVEELVFESTSNRRSALHAKIDVPGGPVDVYCTHLTAVFNSIPYPRDDASGLGWEELWEAEQATQIDQLIAWVDEQGGEKPVIVGDLNTGPQVNGMDGEAPANYAKFEAAGYTSPYIDEVGECTYCGTNSLLGTDDSDDRLIDHVLLKGWGSDISAARIFDENVDAETCGEPIVPGHLSDHYGVAVTVTP